MSSRKKLSTVAERTREYQIDSVNMLDETRD